MAPTWAGPGLFPIIFAIDLFVPKVFVRRLPYFVLPREIVLILLYFQVALVLL